MPLPRNSGPHCPVNKQCPKRSRLAIPIRANHHKSRLGEAFGFEPSLASPSPIGCECMFGDDAFEFLLSAGFEQGITIANKFIAELNAASLICSKQIFQADSTFNERLLAEVFAVEVQQIKCIQNDAMGLPPHG